MFAVEPDSLERFLTRWYGQPDRVGMRPEMVTGVPSALRRWFVLKSRWSMQIEVQNRVLPPDEIWNDQGKRVFWVENQAVYLSAYDPDGEDPEVYDRENVDLASWRATGFPLSTFLLYVAVFEAVLGAAHGASVNWVTREHLNQILEPMQALPMPAWHWPVEGTRLYAGKDLLALAGPNPGSGETPETAEFWSVFLGSTSSDPLAYIDDISGVEWDLIS